jgi:hypothetical protein
MTTLSQKSFSGGEIAPSLYGRVDTAKYTTGLRTCRNSFVMRHGGTANRSGSIFIGEVRDSTKAVRLIPFVFNADQTYILEFGDQYMRVIRDGAYETLTGKTITAITQANPGVITSNAHGYGNDDEVYIEGVVGMTTLNGRNFKVANVTANTYTLKYLDGTAVNTTGFSAYVSGGTSYKIFTMPTPYLEADLPTLQYVQSADVLTIVHPSYAPRELARTGHTNWTLGSYTFAPSISAPTGLAAAGGTGAPASQYVVTAVKEETLEESLASSSATASGGAATSGNPVTVTWNAVVGAQEYNVYKIKNGIYGFIGIAGSTSFTDDGISPDTSDSNPRARNPFGSSDNYPSTCTYFQQRLLFANTNNDPEKVWGSRIGDFKNFTTSVPLQDDDAVTFTMAGRQVNSVKHLIDLGRLVLLTSAGEWTVDGDASGILKPGDINPKQHTYNGSSYLPPIVIGGSALYVQGRGSVVRDLGFDYQADGYRGNDLTVFSAHLFDGYSLVDWSYQQIPHSILWVVRDDGVLLGCTYVKEHQMLAWHRHDMEDGVIENVAVIPEGDEDAVYVVVQRTVDGRSVRYVERLAPRRVDDIVDCIFMDSALTYDGRNTDDSHTMTLSGGTTWTHTEDLTLTSSDAYFTSAEVGNVIQLTGDDGTIIRFTIDDYTSSTVVTGRAHKTVPANMRSVAISTWTRAVDSLGSLWHLEGKQVSILGDGFVVANPNNSAYETVTVTDGAIQLDKTYGIIHVGLPYTSDIETLDVDTDDSETLAGKKKRVARVTLFLEESRGVWVGGAAPEDEDSDFLGGLTELKVRENENYDNPIGLVTGTEDVNIRPEWNSNGRVFIRQTDPLPLSVLAVAPAGNFPFKGGQ